MNIAAKITKIAGIVVLVGVILLCAPVVMPRLAGFEVYAVISGSMEPAIPVGSLVCVKPVAVADLQAGDIIAYQSEIAGGGTITHRLVEIDAKNENLITKGDANDSIDIRPVAYRQLIGEVRAYVPWLGRIALFLSDTSGKLIFAGIILFALALSGISSALDKAYRRRCEKKAQGENGENTKKAKKTQNAGGMILLLLGVGFLLIGVAGFNMYRIMSDYGSSNDLYSDLNEEFVVTAERAETVTTASWYEKLAVDVAGLRQQNPDVRGWIYFENEEISYPVLYSGDDETYLRRSMDKKQATAGSIFIEGINSPDFSDSHTLIYGHNMRNLSMFGRLKYYKQEPDYYKDHMYFQIITEGAAYRYQIFAFEDVSEDSFVYAVPFEPSDRFAQFIDRLLAASYQDTGVPVTKNDKVITLSTCGTSSGEGRFVVHAVRVEEHRY